jgi:hypothetical protein
VPHESCGIKGVISKRGGRSLPLPSRKLKHQTGQAGCAARSRGRKGTVIKVGRAEPSTPGTLLFSFRVLIRFRLVKLG